VAFVVIFSLLENQNQSMMSLRHLVALILFLGVLSHSVSAALMAIDLGSENLKISIVKPGKIPISIVINEMSKRKTTAALAVVNGDRLVGEEAAALSARYPDKVFGGFRDMLGKNVTDASLLEDLKRLKTPFELMEATNRSTVAMKTDQGNGITAEECVASLFEYAAKLAREAADGIPVTDCVIVVPSYFTPGQRQAMKDAASLANLNVLALVNSHAAAALQYGIERDFTNKTEHVVFYDLGAKSAEAALVEYSSFLDAKGKSVSQFEVKDVAWVSHNTGGDALESVLVDLMVEKFDGEASDLMSNKRAIAKLRKQAQKAKHVLSANSDVSVSIEDLLPGVDFRTKITREEFEQASGSVIDRAVVPLTTLLSRNDIKVEDLTAVELLGGSSRVPAVKNRLSESLLGRTLDSHLDADEAVVLGAGLVAANLSTIFRLRQFGMTDKAMYEVVFTLNEDEARTLVPVMKKVPTRRAIKQDNLTEDSFSVDLEWNNHVGASMDCCKVKAPLGTVVVSGIAGVVKERGYSGKVSLHTGMDSSGIFSVYKADAAVEVEVEEKIPIVSNTTANETTTPETNTTETSSEKEEKTPEFEIKKVKRMIKDPLQMNVTLFLNSMTTEHMVASRKVLREYRERDRVKREIAKSRNDLEGFIIDKSSDLQDEDSKLYAHSTAEERQEASKALMEAEDWIYGDEAEKATAAVFTSKLRSIRKTIDAIEDRIFEASSRSDVVESVKSFTEDAMKTIASWAKSKPWITKEETEMVQKNVTELKEWMQEQSDLQSKKPLHEDPLFKARDVLKRLDSVRKTFTRINIKSKPIEKPPKKESEEPAKDEKTEKPEEDKTTKDGEETPTDTDHTEL
jgi:hypoxia up-regulated 1